MSTHSSTPRRLVPAVVTLGLTQILGWGSTFSLPGVIGTQIATSLGASLGTILLGPTVMLTVLALISWWTGSLFERLGARRLMMCGGLILSLGLLAMSVAPNTPMFLASWIVLGVGGALGLSSPAQIALHELFGDRARTANGAMSLVSGLSTTIMWPLSSRMDSLWGWRVTVLVWAAVLVVVYIPIVAVTCARRPKTTETKSDASVGMPINLDRARFTLVAMVIALNGFITWGFSLTLIPLLMLKGLDDRQAVALGSFMGLIQIGARLIDTVGDRTPLASAVTATATMLAAFVLLYAGASFAVAVMFIVFYGFAGGTMAVVRATLPLQLFPQGAYARASARLALPMNLSFAAAPPVFARVLDGPGANTALALSIGLSVAAATSLGALLIVVRRQDRDATADATN